MQPDPRDVDALMERLHRTKKVGDGHNGIWDESVNPDGPEAAATITELRAENARLREALRFYANTPCNMEFGVVNVCPYDDGDIARAALEGTSDD